MVKDCENVKSQNAKIKKESSQISKVLTAVRFFEFLFLNFDFIQIRENR